MKVMSSLDKSRWSPSTIKPVVKNLFNKLNIPFEVDISELVSKGTAFHFQGEVPADSEKFNFMFKTGKGEDDDVALYMDVYPGLASYLKVYCDEKWDKFRFVIGCPIFKGSAFDIFIVIENENYVVYYNGWRYCLNKHHIPIERLTTLTIDGDVTINSLGIVNNWNTSAFGDEGSGASHWELSNLSDGAQPICTRNKPYLGKIPGGLEYGLTFFFQGLVPLYSSG
ncbi:galectin-4-like [Tachysurus fulvidraco]|uniref:galectin-4-like n=1 Tax=Tachysurus fulvidraco TaxID=1234273 RepID=UPI001FEDF0D0|nr:galectin-4-like [Tachysurus fulvidraco]